MECPQYSIWLKTLGCLCTTMDMWCDSIVDHQCLLQHYMSCRHPASDVVENLGADFLYGVHSPGDWLWTRLPVEGFFRNKFLSIYIWSIVITELWQRQVARRWKKISNFCSFCGKRPLMGKFSKVCSKRIHHNTDRLVVFKFREIWLTGNLWNCALLTWQKTFCLALHLSVLCGLRPKSTRASPQECTQSAPYFVQIGSLSAELFPNGWTPWKCARKWIQDSAEAYLQADWWCINYSIIIISFIL